MARFVYFTRTRRKDGGQQNNDTTVTLKTKKRLLLLSKDEVQKKANWRRDWFYEFNLGIQNDGYDNPWIDLIDASFALVTDEWKYVVWPQHDNYEQLLYHIIDPYDEWDL